MLSQEALRPSRPNRFRKGSAATSAPSPSNFAGSPDEGCCNCCDCCPLCQCCCCCSWLRLPLTLATTTTTTSTTTSTTTRHHRIRGPRGRPLLWLLLMLLLLLLYYDSYGLRIFNKTEAFTQAHNLRNPIKPKTYPKPTKPRPHEFKPLSNI